MQDAAAVAGNLPVSRHAEASVRRFWQCPAVPVERALAAKVGTGIDVETHANHGRWIVTCPDCNSAQLAAREDRRFMCVECANVAVEGLWRRVVWPKEAPDIEATLDARPPRNRHWQPGESIEALQAETAAGGTVLAPQIGGLEGHTHEWPKRAAKGGMVTCKSCGLTMPKRTVVEAQAEAETEQGD